MAKPHRCSVLSVRKVSSEEIGESVMFGEGLTYAESIPAQVGAMMGVQTANLAVHGYGNDQAYLRLQTELPHFLKPVAVVSLFMTALSGGTSIRIDRTLVRVLSGCQNSARLIAREVARPVPSRHDSRTRRKGDPGGASCDQRTTSVQAALHAQTAARREAASPRARRRILDNADIPYVFVDIDSSWRLAWDRHPNARAA